MSLLCSKVLPRQEWANYSAAPTSSWATLICLPSTFHVSGGLLVPTCSKVTWKLVWETLHTVVPWHMSGATHWFISCKTVRLKMYTYVPGMFANHLRQTANWCIRSHTWLEHTGICGTRANMKYANCEPSVSLSADGWAKNGFCFYDAKWYMQPRQGQV